MKRLCRGLNGWGRQGLRRKLVRLSWGSQRTLLNRKGKVVSEQLVTAVSMPSAVWGRCTAYMYTCEGAQG